MPIPSGFQAECCLCSRYFKRKSELDAHDRLFAAEHAQILAKGTRSDFRKQATVNIPDIPIPLEMSLALANSANEYEGAKVAALAKLADSQPDPLDRFSPFAKQTPITKYSRDWDTAFLLERMGI